MPLIRCVDCGKDVSSLAPACPSCGRPIAAAAPAPALTAPGGDSTDGGVERTLWEGRPSPSLAILRATLRTGLALALVPGAVCAIHVLAFTSRDASVRAGLGWYRTIHQQFPIMWGVAAVAALITLNGLARVLHALRESFAQHYLVTTQRIVSRSGIISTHVDEIDLRVIDDVLLNQTPMQRLFGLGNIEILSTDRSESRVVLRDVKRAAALRERIRGQVYTVSQRQLFTRPA